MMQWRTLQQDWGKTRQGEETRGEEAGEGRRVVLGAHPETKEKRKMGKRGEEGRKRRGGARWKNGCISPLPACAPPMPPCHAAVA